MNDRALRTLPYNTEAEKSLLGGILIDNRGFERVSEFLRGEHFALVGHGTIYEACAGIIGRGQTANSQRTHRAPRKVCGSFPRISMCFAVVISLFIVRACGSLRMWAYRPVDAWSRTGP